MFGALGSLGVNSCVACDDDGALTRGSGNIGDGARGGKPTLALALGGDGGRGGW
jgi:hypothetical protein